MYYFWGWVYDAAEGVGGVEEVEAPIPVVTSTSYRK